MEVNKIKTKNILGKTMIVQTTTPAESQYAESCVFFAGQPTAKGGEWRTSGKITTKLKNNMNLDPTDQCHRLCGHITYIKGTRETYP